MTTKKFKLSEAANAILEGSKETFDANIKAKQGQRGQDAHKKGEVGDDKLPASVAYGQHDAGIIGHSPEEMDDSLPDYLKGTPSATPPGATPPVGSEKDGVGYRTYSGQPQQTMGRKDVMHPDQMNGNQYEKIRDRMPEALPKNTFGMNKGATFQHYDGSHTAGSQSMGHNESLDMSDDIRALLAGENLSEEFAQKATTIFEAAVHSRIEQIAEEIESNLVEQFEIAVEQVKEDLASKVDDYLNYIAEEYMKENELAIDTGLRAEIAEEFIGGLRNLFIEHYIDIPEDKVDIVAEMAEKVAEMEAQLNEQINTNIDLSKALNEQRKIEAIYTACEGLTQTQVEKLKSLAEGVEFTTEEEFAYKLSTLKESYFKVDVKVADNSALDDEVHIEEDTKTVKSADPLMEQVANILSKK
jgi:hypothetical protein